MILAFDTSTKRCSVALYDGKKYYEMHDESPMRHSVSLMPLIDNILHTNGYSIKDVDKIIVSMGPGSYTGIRVALSCAFGLSDALGIDVFGVSSLRAFSYEREHSCAAIDARRGFVYAACYEEMEDTYLSAEELRQRFNDRTVVGEDLEHLFDENYVNVSANAINLIKAYEDLHYTKDVEANYLRLHEAERNKRG